LYWKLLCPSWKLPLTELVSAGLESR
jgi:hypothetical protein